MLRFLMPVYISKVLAAMILLALTGCDRPPILIGFVGPLTGPYSDLGVHGRNGVQLALEDVNALGGFAGRRLELVVRDDKGSAEGAIQADTELIKAGVRAIIGHMTSAQSVAALPLIQEAGMVLLSPSSSAAELSGIRDYFFRVQPSSDTAAVLLAEYVAQELGLTRMAAVLDMGNKAFTEPYYRYFAQTFTALGGILVAPKTIDPGSLPDWMEIALSLGDEDPDGVLVVLSARDLAALTQAMSVQGVSPRLFSSFWAMTEELFQAGGRTVENIIFSANTVQDRNTPAHLAFQKRYQQRFGHSPSFAAVQAYDAMRILALALEQAKGMPALLPQALTGIRDYPGLHRTISIDAYGDTIGPVYITTAQDGQFIVLQQIMPTGDP